jgi:hypothetical protein
MKKLIWAAVVAMIFVSGFGSKVSANNFPKSLLDQAKENSSDELYLFLWRLTLNNGRPTQAQLRQLSDPDFIRESWGAFGTVKAARILVKIPTLQEHLFKGLKIAVFLKNHPKEKEKVLTLYKKGLENLRIVEDDYHGTLKYLPDGTQKKLEDFGRGASIAGLDEEDLKNGKILQTICRILLRVPEGRIDEFLDLAIEIAEDLLKN